MKVLITGGTGQVGFEIVRLFSSFATVLAPTRQELDLFDLNAISDYLIDKQPDLVINTAAWTAVDAAETERDCALILNSTLPAMLANYCATNNKWLIHFSTDYVYPGHGDTPWQESDSTGPLSYYGETKLAGDITVQNSGAKHIILRTSWVYAARGKNFLLTMLKLGATKDTLSVVADQWGAPTPARLLANLTLLFSERIRHNLPLESGVYHAAPKGHTNWHQFATKIFSLYQQKKAGLLIQNAEQVKAISSTAYPTPAQRPKNSRMDTTKIEKALNIQLPDWQNQLHLTLDELL
jgi:dTDP-4-dehydrorhamnose reductase